MTYFCAFFGIVKVETNEHAILLQQMLINTTNNDKEVHSPTFSLITYINKKHKIKKN